MNDERIGLTVRQVSKLHKLVEEYRAKAGRPLDKTVACVRMYVDLLALGGAIERAPDSAAAQRLRKRINRERSKIVHAFGGLLGRTPTADDFIRELSRFVTVPAVLADAVRRDIETLPQ